MPTFIPQFELHKITQSLLTYVTVNLTTKIAASLESESWLYRTFHGIVFGGCDVYDGLKKIVLATDEDFRYKLELRLGFDKDRTTMPTIHIHVPGEGRGRYNGIGMGYDENIWDTNADSSITFSMNRSFLSNYEFIVTAGNRDETVMIYELLKALFVAGNQTFLAYFPSFDFSGKDLLLKNDLVPEPMFVKALVVQVDYNISAPIIESSQLVDDIEFEGKLIEESGDTAYTEPIVVIRSVELVEGSNVDFSCEVLSEGSEDVTESGICYALSHLPTIADNKVVISSGLGPFVGGFTYESGVEYRVRAFATTSIGTAYSDVYNLLISA
jgi:hypothetical protein